MTTDLTDADAQASMPSGAPDAQDEGKDLNRRLRKGLVWLYVSRYAGKLIFFVATLVLARLLTPEDFALVALALAILMFVDAADFGVGAALVWLDEKEALRDRSVAFTLNNLSVAIVAVALFFLAPTVAEFTGDDRVVWVFRALILVAVIRALGLTHANLLRREMDFHRQFYPELWGGIVKGGLAVALAFAGMGVWALVIGTIAGAATKTTGLWMVVPFRPRFELGLDGRARRLITYGAHVSFLSLLSVASANLDYILIGHALGLTALGYYVIAYRIPQLILEEGLSAASQALFPYYARAREAAADPGGRFVGTTRVSSLIAAPVVAVLAGLATPIIVFYFGEKWEPAAAVLPALAFYAAIKTVSGFAGDLYLALGRPWILWALAIPAVVVTGIAIWFTAPHGITAVGWALAAVGTVWSVIRWQVATWITGVRWRDLGRALSPAVVGGVPAGLVGAGLALVVPTAVAATVGPVVVVGVFLGISAIIVPDVRQLVVTASEHIPGGRLFGRSRLGQEASS